jgi:predicted phosphodiesterase
VTRLAVFSDVHGNLQALEAVVAAIRDAGPDAILEPGRAIDALRELEQAGALIVSGNTDIAVADFDFGAAFPWYTDGVPDTVRIATEWAHDALEDDQLDWLRRLPAERRLRADDGTLALVVHASPGSQTHGFEVRDLGFRLIVNGGSAGYVFDGEPTASWALATLEGGEVQAEIRRAEFDTMAVAEAISARGLPGDVYRAATVRTGKLVR